MGKETLKWWLDSFNQLTGETTSLDKCLETFTLEVVVEASTDVRC
jgi:hypothetical protein